MLVCSSLLFPYYCLLVPWKHVLPPGSHPSLCSHQNLCYQAPRFQISLDLGSQAKPNTFTWREELDYSLSSCLNQVVSWEVRPSTMFLPHDLSDHSARLYFMLILNVYHVNIVHVPSKKREERTQKAICLHGSKD